MCGCDLGNFSGTEQMLFHMVCGCGQELPEAGGSSYSQLTSLDFLHVLKKCCKGKALCFRLTGQKMLSFPGLILIQLPIQTVSAWAASNSQGLHHNPFPQLSWRRWALVYFVYCDSLY